MRFVTDLGSLRSIFASAMALALFGSLTWSSHTARGADFDSWNQAVTALEQRNYADAAERFESWISEIQERDLHSFSAHYNAAVAYRGAGRTGKAIYHLVQTMRWTANPITNFDTATRITELERQAGLREGLSDSPVFVLTNLISPPLGSWLVSIGTWALLLMIAGYGIHMKTATDIILRGLALTVLLLGVSGLFGKKLLPHFYVLDGTEEVRVYSQPTPTETDEPIALLPPGAIVSISAKNGAYTQVTGPVTGWIGSDRAISLD